MPVDVKAIGAFLKDDTKPLKARFRALFTLKNLNTEECVNLIGDCFGDSSDLLKHELAYCLGQMGRREAIPILEKLLEDRTTSLIVRHEAGEALGAIGGEECTKIVSKFVNDEAPEVAETCLLAEARSKIETSKNVDDNSFGTIDPALPMHGVTDVSILGKYAIDPTGDSYTRYSALFKLRNINTDDSALELGKCLNCMETSALQRHEVAFILGQLTKECTVDALAERLHDLNETPMVRHECAEALGAIGTTQCMELLRKYTDDGERIVRESCLVALDMCDYANSDEFQYANGVLLTAGS